MSSHTFAPRNFAFLKQSEVHFHIDGYYHGFPVQHRRLKLPRLDRGDRFLVEPHSQTFFVRERLAADRRFPQPAKASPSLASLLLAPRPSRPVRDRQLRRGVVTPFRPAG